MRIPIFLTRLFFMLMMLCATQAMAQNTAILTIATTGSANLKIVFAGKKYNLLDRSCTFQNMKPGEYTLVVYQMGGDKIPGTPWKEVYNGNITLTAQKHLEISILRFGKMAWDEGIITMDDWGETVGSNPVESQTGGGSGQAVADAQFERILSSIKGEYDENDRLANCKVIFKNNLFNAKQLSIICKTFYNENLKFEAAKLGYDYCVDKGNYFMLADLFYDRSLKNALMQFIASK